MSEKHDLKNEKRKKEKLVFKEPENKPTTQTNLEENDIGERYYCQQ